MSKWTPYSKPVAGTAAGAAVAVFVWLLKEFGGILVPEEISLALVVLVSAAAAYLKREVVGKEVFRKKERARLSRLSQD